MVLNTTFSLAAPSQSKGVLADYVVSEVKQLNDGNRIEQTLVGEYAQDIEGRTRLRYNDIAVIADPVNEVSWEVDIPNGVAFRQRVQWAPSEVVHRQSDGLHEGAFEMPSNAMWPYEAIYQDMQVTELGVRLIDGVESTGRRWLYAIPAGTIGNVEPIEVHMELWTTDAFGFTLPMLSITEDALNGVTRSEMKNIRAMDLDAAFFNPDARYEMYDLNSSNPWPRSKDRVAQSPVYGP